MPAWKFPKKSLTHIPFKFQLYFLIFIKVTSSKKVLKLCESLFYLSRNISEKYNWMHFFYLFNYDLSEPSCRIGHLTLSWAQLLSNEQNEILGVLHIFIFVTLLVFLFKITYPTNHFSKNKKLVNLKNPFFIANFMKVKSF